MFVSGSPQAIDASTIKDVCTKYIYNRAPAIAAVGTFSNTGRLQRLNLTCTIKGSRRLSVGSESQFELCW